MVDATDLIYEAAVNAELWPQALDAAKDHLDAVSGELILFDSIDQAPQCKATDFTRAALTQWREARLWDGSVLQHVARSPSPKTQMGVMSTLDMVSEEEWEANPRGAIFKSIGLYDQLFSPIFMPTGEVAFFSFERMRKDGRFQPGAADEFTNLLPHFSRAALVASRLGLERAIAAAQALEVLGIPAAVLSRSGVLKSANDLLASEQHRFMTTGLSERAHLVDKNADALFQAAIREAGGSEGAIRSIAIRGEKGTPIGVIHVLPLKRTAHEILFGADVLVVATTIDGQRRGPKPGLLIALFDLTPTEARLASALGTGTSVAEFASANGITSKTARTYLERIFVKTGCRRQTDLIQLLRDVEVPDRSPE